MGVDGGVAAEGAFVAAAFALAVLLVLDAGLLCVFLLVTALLDGAVAASVSLFSAAALILVDRLGAMERRVQDIDDVPGVLFSNAIIDRRERTGRFRLTPTKWSPQVHLDIPSPSSPRATSRIQLI